MNAINCSREKQGKKPLDVTKTGAIYHSYISINTHLICACGKINYEKPSINTICFSPHLKHDSRAEKKPAQTGAQAGPLQHASTTETKEEANTDDDNHLTSNCSPNQRDHPAQLDLCTSKCFSGTLCNVSTPLNSYSKAEHGLEKQDLVGIFPPNFVQKPDSGCADTGCPNSYLSLVLYPVARVPDIPKTLSSACRRPEGA